LLENLSSIIIGNYQKNWSGTAKKCRFSRLRRSFFALEKSYSTYFFIEILRKIYTMKNSVSIS